MALALPTATDVRVVITTDLTDPQIDSIIADASLAVESCAALATYTSARQQAIIKWVAAHFINFINGQGGAISLNVLGSSSVAYANAMLGDGLKSSAYGQQALALDPSGCIGKIGSKAKPTVWVL